MLDMTKGKIFTPLFKFTIPLVLGNLFQLTYNAADSIIVGRFVGESALAAVGTATPLMNIGILLLNGMCMGASVLASADFGAGNEKLLKRQLSTTVIAGMAFSLAFSICMILLAGPVLKLIQTPEEVLPMARQYLRIVYAGLIFTFIYNFLANTLRALGDSRTSLYFLIASSLINIVSDIFFVAVLHWEVMGCAVATVLSQMLCCVFCLVYIRKKVPILNFGREWLIFDKSLIGKTVSFGSTSAMQQVCLQIGKLIIQTMVNTQGVSVIAAFTAVNRVDDFAYTPQQNIGHAMTTFIAQNEGAGEDKRVQKGFRAGIIIEVIYSVCLCAVIFALAPQIMGLFAQDGDSQVMTLGTSYLRLIAFMYILPGFTNGIQGFFRGIGDMKVTLYSTTMNMVGRCVALYVMLMVLHMPFVSLAWANMAGWILMLLFEVPLLVRQLKRFQAA